jgi:hypothetical protein
VLEFNNLLPWKPEYQLTPASALYTYGGRISQLVSMALAFDSAKLSQPLFFYNDTLGFYFYFSFFFFEFDL